MIKRDNIVAVLSGTSKVGATWVSITLAHALALLKKKVLFFDADAKPNSIHLQLGVSGKGDVNNLLNGDLTLNQVIHFCEKTKFSIISNIPSPALPSFPIGRLQVVIEDLSLISTSYDNVIIDAGDGYMGSNHVFSFVAGKIFVVCNDAPEVLEKTYAFIKDMYLKYERPIGIIINNVNSIIEGQRAYNILNNACREYLSFSPYLIGVVRRDTRVRDAIRNQTPMITRYPTSEAVDDILIIANKILGKEYGRKA